MSKRNFGLRPVISRLAPYEGIAPGSVGLPYRLLDTRAGSHPGLASSVGVLAGVGYEDRADVSSNVPRDLTGQTPSQGRCSMGDYSKTFEWIDFPQGRVRYAGGRRGRDEPPIETFAVEIDARVYYGEIREVFPPEQNHYSLEVVSFGWLQHDWSGVEPHPEYCASFTLNVLSDVQSLLCKVVPIWRSLEDRPAILYESFQTRFTGDIFFRDGWALVRDDEGRV